MRFYSFICLIILINAGCKKNENIAVPAVPRVSTSQVVDVDVNTALAEGLLIDDGGKEVIECGFCYDTMPRPLIGNNKIVDTLNEAGNFKEIIRDLRAKTRYFLRAYCTNQAGTGYGNEVSFTTKPAIVPCVRTLNVTEITKNSAVIMGSLSDCVGKISSKGFCYSLTPDPTMADLTTEVPGDYLEFSTKIAGLLPASTYYVRAFAINSVGTGYGSSLSFKTKTFFNITVSVTEITRNSAKCSVNLSTDNEKPILEWGICWSSHPNTDVNDATLAAASGTASMTAGLDGLSLSTTYFIRPFIVTASGTEYGSELNFTTIGSGDTVTDIDGNIYNVVKIGNQTWMADNLRVSRYRNESPIAETWAYNNDEANVAAYGRLYSFSVAQSGTVCPTGWHVPSNTEWRALGSYLIMNGYNYDGSIPSSDPFISEPYGYSNPYNSNKLAKSLTSVTGWNISNTIGSAASDDFPEKRNLSGFNAKPAGHYHFIPKEFFAAGISGYWWSSDKINWICGLNTDFKPSYCTISAWYINANSVELHSFDGDGVTACSIRCIKDL